MKFLLFTWLLIGALAPMPAHSLEPASGAERVDQYVFDIIDQGNCLPEQGWKFAQERTPELEAILLSLRNAHWVFENQLRHEISQLSICEISKGLKQVPTDDSDSIVQYENVSNKHIVAIRRLATPSVILDSQQFALLNPLNQALLLIHEAMHSFIPTYGLTKGRNSLIRNIVYNIERNHAKHFSPEKFALQMNFSELTCIGSLDTYDPVRPYFDTLFNAHASSVEKVLALRAFRGMPFSAAGAAGAPNMFLNNQEIGCPWRQDIIDAHENLHTALQSEYQALVDAADIPALRVLIAAESDSEDRILKLDALGRAILASIRDHHSDTALSLIGLLPDVALRYPVPHSAVLIPYSCQPLEASPLAFAIAHEDMAVIAKLTHDRLGSPGRSLPFDYSLRGGALKVEDECQVRSFPPSALYVAITLGKTAIADRILDAELRYYGSSKDWIENERVAESARRARRLGMTTLAKRLEKLLP